MKRFLFFLGFIALILPCSGLIADQIVLDQVMSRDEQKRIGIDRLTMKQKIELENWLNKTFILKVQDKAHPAILSMSININNGEKIQLSDNSVWEIAPSDVPTAAIWITPFPVKITPSDDPDYPCLLVNTNSGVSVKAKEITPSPATPPAQ